MSEIEFMAQIKISPKARWHMPVLQFRSQLETAIVGVLKNVITGKASAKVFVICMGAEPTVKPRKNLSKAKREALDTSSERALTTNKKPGCQAGQVKQQ